MAPIVNKHSVNPHPRSSGGLTDKLRPHVKHNARSTADSTRASAADRAAVLSLSDFVIEADEYIYPTEDKVPGGFYLSKITQVSCRTKNDKALLDVCYEIESMPTGEIYHIKQTYPKESQPLKDFYRALVAAGVRPGSTAEEIIGVQERIHLAYISTTSAFGSIIKRIPEPLEEDVPKEPPTDDDEFDDFLEDED